MTPSRHGRLVFFFNDTATTEIYTLSLHDALPISGAARHMGRNLYRPVDGRGGSGLDWSRYSGTQYAAHRLWHRQRSEEHTSELQSPCNLVCRLLLEKKK